MLLVYVQEWVWSQTSRECGNNEGAQQMLECTSAQHQRTPADTPIHNSFVLVIKDISREEGIQTVSELRNEQNLCFDNVT